MATNHSGIASLLFYFEASNILESANISHSGGKSDKGKDKITGEDHHLSLSESSQNGDVPLILLLRLLNQPLCLRSIAHLEQVAILILWVYQLLLKRLCVIVVFNACHGVGHGSAPGGCICCGSQGRI